MEPLVISLEAATTFFSTIEEDNSHENDKGSKHWWKKNPLYIQFVVESRRRMYILKKEILRLLGVIVHQQNIPKKIYLISHYEAEVSFFSLELQNFYHLLSLGEEDLGPTEDIGLVKLTHEWATLSKCYQQLEIFLKFFERVLELACLQGILQVNASNFFSHISVEKFWTNYFGSDQFQIEFSELIQALETELSLNIIENIKPLSQRLCSKKTFVTIFQFNELTKNGLHFGISEAIEDYVSKKYFEDLILSKRFQEITDISECTRFQHVLVSKLNDADELLSHLKHLYKLELELIEEIQGSTLFPLLSKTLLNNEFQHKIEIQQNEIQSLYNTYQRLIERMNQLVDKEEEKIERRLSFLEPRSRSTSVRLSNSNSRTNSFNSLPGDQEPPKSGNENPELQTLLFSIQKKFKITANEVQKWKSEYNYVDLFGIPRDQILYFQIYSLYGSTGFPHRGKLFMYQNYLCFQRKRNPTEVFIHPISSIVKILKTEKLIIDSGIQVQMSDKTNFHIGQIENRDDIFDFINLLLKKNEALNSYENDLIQLGFIVIEELYENQKARLFGGFTSKFSPMESLSPWTNIEGKPKTKDDVILPNLYWQWMTVWDIDFLGQVDTDGWEYSSSWQGTWKADYSSSFVRRRKWKRKRIKLPEIVNEDKLVKDPQLLHKAIRKLPIYSQNETLAGYYIL